LSAILFGNLLICPSHCREDVEECELTDPAQEYPMYKNLAPTALGLFCSQNELIELTLTHGFCGLHVPFDSFFEQVTSKGIDQAIRFIKSAPVKITSTELPIQWHGDDASFATELARLPKVLEMIRPLNCRALVTNVMPGCDTRPYHENFEMHSQRLAQIAESIEAFEMKLGIGFEIPFGEDNYFANPFIKEPKALVALVKTSASANLALIVDAWRWTVAGESFDLLSDLPSDRIVDVRVADLPADWNPNRVCEADRLLYGETNAVDGPALFQILETLGYEGAVTPFAAPSQFEDVRSDAAVKRAAASMDLFLSGQGPRTAAPEAETDSSGESSEEVSTAESA
jgi:sugar phosphate isomerase/epimerase